MKRDAATLAATSLASLLLLVLLLPILGLLSAVSLDDLGRGLTHPLFAPALKLSALSSSLSLVVIVLGGTPLAWWLSRGRERSGGSLRWVGALVDLPVVLPPAVVGIALLAAFGRRGLLGPWLESAGISVSFTTAAVVLAQVVVASPFYVRAAEGSFRRVDPDTWLVARTLGATRAGAFFRVVVPSALPGLLAGAGLAWARAVGEFGATLLFAGSLRGTTQTLPLAIYEALEIDLGVAVAIAVVLAGMAATALLLLRLLTRHLGAP